jgi:hypothetical protein
MKVIDRIGDKLVLGDGETTGHQHTIRENGARLFEINADTRLLKLPKMATLRHEKGDTPAEHRDIHLPIGEPCVTYKRQYSPDGWSRVED